MKKFNHYINEKLKLSSQSKLDNGYHYHPKSFSALRELLIKLLNERGKDANLNDIDISQVTTFYDENEQIGLFEKLDPHNIKIDKWDVSNVTNMKETFYMCYNFNCNLSEWDVREVRNMYWMFTLCEEFKGKGLENWKVDKCNNFINNSLNAENDLG